MTVGSPKGVRVELKRSFDVYYRDAERFARMHRLHRVFVRPDDMVFDIGAHVGDRTESFAQLGARVICVEPQPTVHRALRLIHGRKEAVTLVQAAIGASDGSVEMFVNRQNPTVSTLSADLVAAAPLDAGWVGQRWDSRIEVPMLSLDSLIATHGMPAFVKIDVEGFEAEALRGLNHSVPILSFEFTTLQRNVARACLQRLQALGPYTFNFSLGEDHRLQQPTWVTPEEMAKTLGNLSASANSGDVFARISGGAGDTYP